MSTAGELIFENSDLQQLQKVIEGILSFRPLPPVITFSGDLGTGKTTLIKELIKQLGSADPVSSPTFSILNEYSTSDLRIFHSDWYRIQSAEELYDAGIDEYFEIPNSLFIIEWPEIGKSLLPASYLSVEIRHQEGNRDYRIFKV